LWLSPLLGAAFGLVGMYASWYADVPSGAVITIVGSAMFAAAYAATDVTRRRTVSDIDDHRAIA